MICQITTVTGCAFILKRPLFYKYDHMTLHVEMATATNRMIAVRGFPSLFSVLVILSGLFSMFSVVHAEIRSAVINKQNGQLSVIDGYQEDFIAFAKFSDNIKISG